MNAGVVDSLDALAALGVDPTAQVYARVFARWPQTERLFFRDRDNAIRAHMLFEVIQAVLDHAGPGHYSRGYITGECVHHLDDLGVSSEAYVGLFAVLRDVVAEVLAGAWTPDMAAAWETMLDDVAAMVAA